MKLKSILNKIEQDQIKPKAKWYFQLKNISFWVAGILSVFVGAITISVIIFILKNQEWGWARKAGGELKVLLYVLPYFWIVVFALFVIITYYNLRHTKRGYKFGLWIVITIYFGVTILCGIGLYVIGMGKTVERTFVNKAPLYGRMIERRQIIWHNPEEGLLVGKILEIKIDDWLLLDIRGEEWLVNISQANRPPHLEFKTGMNVKIFGEIKDKGVFIAEGVRPDMMPERRCKNSVHCKIMQEKVDFLKR